MSIEIEFIDRDKGGWYTLSIPDGLKDEAALLDYLKSCDLSRGGRRAAFKVAKKVYNSYDKEWWEQNEEGDDDEKAKP